MKTANFSAIRTFEDHLIAGNDEGFISNESLARGRLLVNEAVKVLNGYMTYLKRASAGER